MKAVQVKNGVLEINKEECKNCGRCSEKCPFQAMAEGTHGFKIYIGGRWGKKVSHGKPLSKIFTSEEDVLNTVEKCILFYREYGNVGERFSDTIERIGFAEVERQLLSDELLKRKQEIIAD